MKKITFCITTLGKGGAERVICNLANYFSELYDYDVSIVTINKSSIEYELNKKIKVYYANDLSKKGKIINFIKRNRNFSEIIKKILPDIVVSFLPVAVFLTLANKHKFKYKTIISVRNDPNIEYGSKKNNILMKLLFPKTNAIVFQTEDAMSYFKKINIEHKKIILNPVSENFINKKTDEKREKRIVNVGRLEKQKNHKLLIETFNQFQKEHNDYILEIYGSGTMRKELENLILSLNLSQKVFLCGQVKDVARAIKDASLFVLSSDYEGMPNALVEAMVLGVPVISTDCPCGGPKTIIKNYKNGILIPINDSKKMLEAMKYILESKDKIKKFSIESKKLINFVAPELINEQWHSLIEEVINK